MSTRATYLMSNRMEKPTCFYIHYDGYPEGAAHYFLAMHYCENRRGGFAEMFFRANGLAELTKSHDYHGDTEYRYTLDNEGTLIAEESIYVPEESTQWKAFFKGHWYEFVNQYMPELKKHEKLYAFILSDEYGHKKILTINQAREIARGKFGDAGLASASKIKNYNPNYVESLQSAAASLLSQIQIIEDSFEKP